MDFQSGLLLQTTPFYSHLLLQERNHKVTFKFFILDFAEFCNLAFLLNILVNLKNVSFLIW